MLPHIPWPRATNVKALFLLLFGLLATSQAMACECPTPLTSENARKAKNVFVFRLLGTQMDPNTNSDFDEAATGRIQVVANVRGKTTAKEIAYSTSRFCCGLKLATGAYYIAVLDEDAKRFNASSANLIGLQIGFGRSEADLLESVLRGKSKLEDAFPSGNSALGGLCPPPDPMPPHLPKGRRSDVSRD